VSNYSDDILKNPTLLPAIMFYACRHCLYTDNELDPRPTRVCPNCGKKGRKTLYQRYNIQYFLEMVQRLYIKDEPQAVVLIVCTMLERLVEDLLVEIMTKHSMDDDAIDDELRRFERFSDRAECLFKKYSGMTLAKAIESIHIKGFWQTWKDVKKKRDGFIHGKASMISRSDGQKSFVLALDAQNVFSQLHNKYSLRQ